MSTTAPAKATPTKPKKEKKERAQQQQGADRLKSVVRRLPPNLPEEVFWQSVQTWVTDETVTWKHYVRGKFRSRFTKENIPSRAYIAFKKDEQLALFSKEYDGHIFRDKAGNETQAVVEFAPYQKVPSEKKKADARNGTIEKDESYISFIQSLTAPTNTEPVTLEALIASTQPAPQPKTTPLLEALKAEKAEKTAVKEKVAIMRSQTHEASRKEEGKKKPSSSKASEASAPPMSKKAAKKAAAAAAAAKDSPVPSQKDAIVTIASKHPPKAPKAARQQQPPQPQAQIQSPKAQVPPAPNGGPSTAPSSNATESPSTSTTPTPSRRGRPVLGLASRHFEAALSGAGVSERKPRKDREREEVSKEKETRAKDAPAVTTSSKPKPPSPKRDRGKRNESVGYGESSGGAKVPSILQRIDGGPPTILQRGLASGADGASKGAAPGVPEQAGANVPSGGRGGRYGRGRGGRGGSANRGG